MKKNMKLVAVLLALVMVLGMLAACGGGGDNADKETQPPETQTPETTPPETQTPDDGPSGEGIDRSVYNIPEQYTKVKIFDGTYGFGDAEIISAMNDDESAFYIQFVCFDEDQILEGTVTNGICMVTYDLTGFVSGDAQLIYDDTLASSEPWQALTGAGGGSNGGGSTIARSEYNIPEQYTKVKIFDGTYGFGDAEIISAMNDDESAFYIQFVCFDEDQILEGTVNNGICMVTYDLTGFVSGDAQLIYDDTLASNEPWQTLT